LSFPVGHVNRGKGEREIIDCNIIISQLSDYIFTLQDYIKIKKVIMEKIRKEMEENP
jgi:hypothetical protein